MSKLSLRSSKRRTKSPPILSVEAKSDVPLIKKPKSAAENDASDSESSSDEFVRPSKDLKVNAGILLSRNGPSPVPDFSSIEKSIFAGVSKLSDSESDCSDFEEVPASSPKESTKDDSGILSNENEQVNNVKSTVPETVKEKAPPKPVRTTRRKPAAKEKEEAPKLKAEKLPDKKSTDVVESAADAKSKGRGTRAVKRKTAEVPEDTPLSPEKQVKKEEQPEKKTSRRAAKPGPSTSSAKAEEEEKKPKGTKGPARKGKASGNSETPKVPSPIKEEKTSKKVAPKEEIPSNIDTLDIAQLLALGEGLTFEAKSEHSDSDGEDWEEVDPNDVKKHEIPKEGVQITLDMPEFSWRRKKQKDHQACMQAEMNRAFNRVRRELQLLCHKTSLLLWLGHGIFLNRAISNQNVLGMALSLVPPDLCEVPKTPGRKYITKLLQWFASYFECSEGFPEDISNGKTRPLTAVLEQNFSRKYAKSTKEMTFMFIAVLRGIGIEARLVISFQPMPLKPQSDELLSINSKKRGRVSKKEPKDNSEAEDDPEPQTSKAVVSSPYFKNKGKTPAPKLAGKGKAKAEVEKESEKPAKPKGPSSAVKESEKNKKGKETSAKSAPASAKSPPKARELRRKAARKSYSEKTDSEDDDSDEEKPILSPDRKKGDKNLSERLKAAAAKRVPTNRRFSLKGTTPRKSTSQDSDSDFVPESKRDSGVESSRSSSSPVKKNTSRRSESQNSDSESDSDFEKKPKRRQPSKNAAKKTPTKTSKSKGRPSKGSTSKSKGNGRKVLSSDDDSGKKQPTCSGFDYWVEVYLKDEDRWACIDVPSKKVDSSKEILAKASHPVCYVMAFNLDGTLKDVTKRYSPKFSQVTAKQRVSADWWNKSLKPFLPKNSAREAAEDSEMNLVELDRPMPKNVAECKNHPLYVLKRHLLKFEAIYPPDSPSLGFVRNEPIYARQNVYTLHSRELWIKEAKVVRIGEEPYKIVKARPKWDRLSGKVISDLPLEVFGPWQVEDYVPPPAVDGKVPRNAYGNVELFKPSMLPKGCVHLQVPSLSRVAKKLRIDCAPAVVGFDYHSGGSHPTFDGFVVCEEFVDVLMDAWNKDIDESAKRREEREEKRIYGNWRRLIKGLLIREALKARYDFKGEGEAGEQASGEQAAGGSQAGVNPEAREAARITAEDGPLPCLFPKLMANIRAQKGRQRRSTPLEKKPAAKGKGRSAKPAPKGKGKGKGKGGRKRKDETSEEEESDWDSTTSEEEEDVNMVLLSDEDSGSEFEDLKK